MRGASPRLLVRYAWLPFVVGGVLAILAVALGELRPHEYEAVTRVAVSPVRPADLGQTQAIREVMKSYLQDIPTVEMAMAAADRLAADPRCRRYERDPGRLLGRLRVASDLNVYEIQVKARSTELAEAVCISEHWAAAFVEGRERMNVQLDPLDRIVTAARDQTVAHRIWPRRRLVALGGGVAGALLGAVTALARAFAASALIHEAQDVEGLGWQVLAVVRAVPYQHRLARPTRGRRLPRRGAVARYARAVGPIVLLALLGGGTAYALSIARPVVWRARTRIAVEPARGSDWGQTQAIREIMKGYSEDIRTRRMAERVNALAEADEPADQLLARLNVAPKEGVYEIIVDVRHPDREAALRLSRLWATLFVEDRTRANLALDQRDRILTRLRDQTTVRRDTAGALTNAASGLVIGLLVGATAVAWLRLLDRRFLCRADDVAHLGVRLLAAIPDTDGHHPTRRRPTPTQPEASP